MAQPSLRGCLALASTLSTVSAILAGLVGAYTTTHYGRDLAMGMAIYAGNTEPNVPWAPYPWGLFALGVALAVAGFALERVREDRAVVGHALMHLGAYWTALVPFVHLYELWRRT